MVAVDKADQGNGCLQVLTGSHRLGRVEHGRFGGQVGADPARVQAAMNSLPLAYFEAEPGDALFFHSNTLHASAANTSDRSRWSLIMTYNARSNDPFLAECGHAHYHPLQVVEDDAILAWPANRPVNITRSFLRVEAELAARAALPAVQAASRT